jgi:hypothetical protein
MSRRSLICRLERLEARCGVTDRSRLKIEFHHQSPKDAPTRWHPSAGYGQEADHTLQVIFVKPKAEGAEPGMV